MPRMKQVVIFRHAAHEGPGYFAEFLDRKNIRHRLVRIDRDDPLPFSLDGISGLVFMGGPMSVNDELPWIPEVVRLIQRAVADDVPVLGHCLGGQLLAKALGAPVTRNPAREIGWWPVQVVANAAARTWLNGLPHTFDVYHWHGETFAIPADATHILASEHCRNQAFVLGKHLGLQCHVEMTAPMVAEWARTGPGNPSATVQTPAQMTQQLDQRVDALHRVADVLYQHWIRGLA